MTFWPFTWLRKRRDARRLAYIDELERPLRPFAYTMALLRLPESDFELVVPLQGQRHIRAAELRRVWNLPKEGGP